MAYLYGGGAQQPGYGGGGSKYPGAPGTAPVGGYGAAPGAGFGAPALGSYQGPPSGYGAGYHGVPAGADPQLWQWFQSVDANRSGTITAEELQQCLINGDWSTFDIDTVKMLMSIFDTDRSGTIGFKEFSGIWNYIKDWQNVFRRFDQDRSGTIDRGELDNALRQFGYELSPQLLQLLIFKYQSVPNATSRHRAVPAGITFDRFVRACVMIKSLTESFQALDRGRSGVVTLDYDTFLNTVLSAP